MAQVKAIRIDATNGIMTIEIPINAAGTISKSGKSNLIACTNGNQETPFEYGGKPLYANINITTFVNPK